MSLKRSADRHKTVTSPVSLALNYVTAHIAAREIGKMQRLNAINGRKHVREDLAGDELIAPTITFYPPDRRYRDDDNMIAAFKSLRDGMTSALKVNDKRFRPTYEFGEALKGGKIEVGLL